MTSRHFSIERTSHDIIIKVRLPSPARVVPLAKASFFWLLLVALVTPSILWIARDRSVWPWDQAWYAEVSTDLWFTLTSSPSLWFESMLAALGTKAPAISWIGQFFVPLGHALGSVEAGLLLFVVLTQLGIVYVIWRIAERLDDRSPLTAVASSVFTASAPLYVGMSHQYFVEPLQCFAVAWMFYLATTAQRSRTIVIALAFVNCLTLGVLAKATTPLYFIFPLGYVVNILFRRRDWKGSLASLRQPMLMAWAIASLAGAGMTAAWYKRNLALTWFHIKDASSGTASLDYGWRDTLINKLQVWLTLTRESMIIPQCTWFIALVIALALVMIIYRRFFGQASGERLSPRDRLGLLAFSQIWLMLFVVSSNITVDSRYLYAILPSISVALIWLLAEARSRALAMILIAFFILQWGVANGYALHLTSPMVTSNWLLPYGSDSSRSEDLKRIVRLTTTDETKFQYHIVGVELPWFNGNSAGFYAAKYRLDVGYRCYYTSLGYAEANIDRAMRRVDEVKGAYFISILPDFVPKPVDFVNRVTIPAVERVESGGRWLKVPFQNYNHIIVFRRKLS
jgi:hypothetical protein